MRDVGHSGRGQADRGDDEGGDRNPIVAEIAQRGVEGGIEQDRCDKRANARSGSSVQDGLDGTKAISAPPIARKVG